jgi:HD-GYP domain-containing protein (c-di-GMP phosphodiesterase class II)
VNATYTGLPTSQRREAQEERAEYVLMCRALALIYFTGVGFVAMWALLMGGFDAVSIGCMFICMAVCFVAIIAESHRAPRRAFVIPLALAVAIQMLLAMHYQQVNAGFFLLMPSFFLVLFFWHDRPVLISGMLLVMLAFVAQPLLIGGDAVVARLVMTTPIFLGLVLTTGYLGNDAAQLDRNRARFESTVASLLVALQERDGYTADHSEETVELAMAVGDLIGIVGDERTILADVALLHDIGKIGIPNEILNKADGLDEHEWEFMKRHPEIGERIVAPVPGFAEVAKAIRHEHERWDGAGYPDGLSGEEIPLASRIVLVCDAFHAMITDRPYRKAIGLARAREELTVHAGTQFDPEVVDALLAVIDRSGVPEGVGRAKWVPSATSGDTDLQAATA